MLQAIIKKKIVEYFGGFQLFVLSLHIVSDMIISCEISMEMSKILVTSILIQVVVQSCHSEYKQILDAFLNLRYHISSQSSHLLISLSGAYKSPID